MNADGETGANRFVMFCDAYAKVTTLVFSLLVAIVSVSIIVRVSAPGALRVSFLDVEQGDAILIETPSGHDVLIDGGPNDIVLSRLDDRLNYFDRHIDIIIATHGDADHVTGLIPVLKKYDVDYIVSSPIDADTALFRDLISHVEEKDAVMYVGARGDVFDFGDGVKLYVVYPGGNMASKTDTNDASVSVVLEYGEHTFLLTGDLSAKYEPKLVGSHVPKDVTVFKAGHHGSKTSSGETLLTYISPEYAVISAGKENKYGHPHAETLERLTMYAKETLSTINRGTITFLSDGKMMEVKTGK